MTALSKQAAFGNYSPASIGWAGRWDPEQHPELLTPFSHSGVSFGSMHKLAVPIFTHLLNQLVPAIPGGLVKGTCGCFNPGSVTVGGDRSFHTYALAIDINWSANPMYRRTRPTGPHTLPAKTSSIAHSMGCEWGGDWTYPQDWMHVEVHLSPAQCIAYANTRSNTPLEDLSIVDAQTKAYLDKQFADLDKLVANVSHQLDVVAGIASAAKHSADAVQARLNAPKPQ